MMTQSVSPNHISRVQWDNAVGIARQACARIFRDGGQPADALKVFGLRPADGTRGREQTTWDKAVDLIAQSLCARHDRRAA